MNKVKCTLCDWRCQQPDYDLSKENCRRCNNTRLMDDPAEIFCNMCGGLMCHDITVPSGRWRSDSPCGLHNAKVSGGYESYHLFDMTGYTFSFCEECLRKLFLQCKIPPKVSEYGIGNAPDGSLTYVDRSEQSWEDDKTCYEYRVWKDAGHHHQAYLNKMCNAVKDCENKAVYTLLHNDTDFTEEALCEKHADHKYSNSKLTKFVPNVFKPYL